MGRKPKPIKLTLTHAEAAEILKPAGRGGHQEMHKKLLAQLANGNLTISLDDERLGELVRYMSYGSGGFQGRLRKAFKRALLEAIRGSSAYAATGTCSFISL
jgi:hypothetical protein